MDPRVALEEEIKRLIDPHNPITIDPSLLRYLEIDDLHEIRNNLLNNKTSFEDDQSDFLNSIYQNTKES